MLQHILLKENILFCTICHVYAILLFIYIQNVTTSQMLPFSELHCDKGRLSQARDKPSLWVVRRRKWQN